MPNFITLGQREQNNYVEEFAVGEKEKEPINFKNHEQYQSLNYFHLILKKWSTQKKLVR